MSIGIYKIENLLNGKVYIGQSVNIEKRWSTHKSELEKKYHYNIHLQSAWNKYGGDNFEFSIVEECNIDQLNQCEIYWIAKFDSYENGYNLTPGGGNTESFSKSVIQFDYTGNELLRYASISEAETATGICYSQISECCSHKRKTAGGYIWQYEEGFIDIPQWHFGARMFNEINQLTKDGKLINTFPSSAEAKRVTGICDTSIIRCCHGKLKTAGGYIWMFAQNTYPHTTK
jgi:predicted GIY-YIG superfamily endonuclease